MLASNKQKPKMFTCNNKTLRATDSGILPCPICSFAIMAWPGEILAKISTTKLVPKAPHYHNYQHFVYYVWKIIRVRNMMLAASGLLSALRAP